MLISIFKVDDGFDLFSSPVETADELYIYGYGTYEL